MLPRAQVFLERPGGANRDPVGDAGVVDESPLAIGPRLRDLEFVQQRGGDRLLPLRLDTQAIRQPRAAASAKRLALQFLGTQSMLLVAAEQGDVLGDFFLVQAVRLLPAHELLAVQRVLVRAAPATS